MSVRIPRRFDWPGSAQAAVILICLRAAHSQTISPTPEFLQNVGAQVPVSERLSFEPQFQLGLEGNFGNGNPFAYAHVLHFRPWAHYDGIANLAATGAVSYIYYFTVPEPAITGIRYGALRPSAL